MLPQAKPIIGTPRRRGPRSITVEIVDRLYCRPFIYGDEKWLRRERRYFMAHADRQFHLVRVPRYELKRMSINNVLVGSLTEGRFRFEETHRRVRVDISDPDMPPRCLFEPRRVSALLGCG